MAMAVQKNWSNSPPPIGTAKMSKKAKKAKLSQITKQSVVDQIRSIPKGQDMVVNMSAVRAAIQAATSRDQEEDPPPFDVSPTASSSGDGTGNGCKEWYPSWQFNDEPAWFNLFQNKLLIQPLGRKFIPDPDYNGKGECPLPQRTALFSEIRYDNVIPFEDAVAFAKQEAIRKRDNSARSRGGNLFEPVLRSYPGYEKNQGQPKIAEPPAPSPAYQRVKAANQERDPSWDPAFEQEESTLAGDTADPQDIHLQSLWYYPVNVAMNLYQEGFAQLSSSYWAWMKGDEIYVGKGFSEMYSVEMRMEEMDFHFALEDGCDYLLAQDMETPQYLTDEAVESVFGGLPSAFTNEFLKWEHEELDLLHCKVECSRRNLAAINPLKVGLYFGLGRVVVLNDSYPMNDYPTIWEIEKWEEEEREGLESLGVSRIKEEQQPSPVAANEKPVTAEEIDFSSLCIKLRMTEEPELRYLKWLSSNRECHVSDSNTSVLPHYLGNMSREVNKYASVKQLHTWHTQASCITTTPWVEDKPLPPAVKAPTKGVARRVAKAARRFTHWWTKPVLTFGSVGKDEGEIAPAPNPTDEDVVLASKAIARKIIDESLMKKDDRETIEWLQEKGRPIEEASSPELVNRVMHAIQSEDTQDLYSMTGIYLGKKTRFEQVNEGQNILLLNAKAPPKTA